MTKHDKQFVFQNTENESVVLVAWKQRNLYGQTLVHVWAIPINIKALEGRSCWIRWKERWLGRAGIVSAFLNLALDCG
jgi:hypothetical protein